MDSPATDWRPEPGCVVGAYVLDELLGKGGMGEVYRAHDSRLDRTVAIKFVSAERSSDRKASVRLANEARITSALNHPGIVTVHDIGEFGNRPFIVMELVDGQSLSSHLAWGGLKVREVLRLGTQIADALAAAHAAGVVHRDLKPQNIMITADGRAKIVDFGLGTLNCESSDPAARTHTTRLTIQGTIGYMAPEQAACKPVDMRADQFALGAILYEMVSGRRAFLRDTEVQTLADILDAEPVPLQTLCSTAPPALVAIVARCLQKEPRDRYGATIDLAHDLRVAAADAVTSDTKVTPPAVIEPAPVRRWLLPFTAFAAAAAFTLVGWQWFDARPLAPALSAQSTRHVAVLPIRSLTGDADDQVLADGLVETLTSSLSTLERFEQRLRVVPSTEIRRERIASAKEARQSFGATVAISGSLQRDRGILRVTFNLIDTTELIQVASRTIDLPLEERPRAVEDLVADTVASLLDLQLKPEAQKAMTDGGSRVVGAYELLARGRGFLQRFDQGIENVDRSIDALRGALQADPQFALAHAAAGEAYWRKYELSRQPAWIDRAVEHSERALAINSRLSPIHVVLAMIARGRGRYEEAMAVAERAIELDPVSSDGYRELGRAYEALGRFDNAEATYRRAIAARPGDWLASNTLGSFFIGRARWPEAVKVFTGLTQLAPDNTRAYNNLGASYFGMGQPDLAATMWERSTLIRPTSAATSNLGTYYYRRRRYTDAARAFERAVALSPNSHRLWRNFGAALYWAPGERDKAAAAYARAVELAERELRINPRQATLQAELADSYSMLGRKAETIAAATAVERLGSGDADARFNVASAFEQIGERQKALQWLQQALAAGYSRESVEQSPGLEALRNDDRFKRAERHHP